MPVVGDFRTTLHRHHLIPDVAPTPERQIHRDKRAQDNRHPDAQPQRRPTPQTTPPRTPSPKRGNGSRHLGFIPARSKHAPQNDSPSH